MQNSNLKGFEHELLFLCFFFRNCVEDFLCDMLDELPEEKKNIYMSLSDCKSECNEKTELGKIFFPVKL